MLVGIWLFSLEVVGLELAGLEVVGGGGAGRRGDAGVGFHLS